MFLQVPKHLGQINGQEIFTAVHTVTNEYVEIRSMLLTPTKSHDQFMPALSLIPASLELYGHGGIEAIYTDSLSDKTELEHIFPSLMHDIVPVSEGIELDPLLIPPSYTILLLSSTYQINQRFNELLPALDISETRALHVGFNMEWDVNLTTGIQGSVALLQVAFQDCIYLIQVSIVVSLSMKCHSHFGIATFFP
jgi:hypothetical protein